MLTNNFKSDINKIAFAQNIYGDDVADEIIISFSDSNLDLANAKYLREDGNLCPLSEISEILDNGKVKITKTLSIFHYFALLIPKKGC